MEWWYWRAKKKLQKYYNDAIFLVFEQENYFSLFNVKKNRPVYGLTQYNPYTFIFPFRLDLEFDILTEKNEKKDCEISIIYNKFWDYILFREKEESKTLALQYELGLNYIGNDEITFK